ncbi:MAG: sensor histidine kinase [Campylobacterota bacterium]
MTSEINSYKFNQYKKIDAYSLSIQRAIYDFNNSKSNIFRFPKSFFVDAYLLNENEKIIFSNTKEKKSAQRSITKKVNLSQNRLGAKYLILEKSYSYFNIYIKIAILAISILFFIFISGYLIIKQSITPYQKVNRYLDAFFNDAMHELKTPLGIIQLNLEILKEKQSSKELNRSLNAVKNLNIIYEDIEYLIKYKKVNYTKQRVNFSTFLQDRVDMLNDLALSKNIELKSYIQKNLIIEINRVELQRIIDNTISNAIKYSNKKSCVEIFLEYRNNYLTFIVRDYGKGIKNTSKIFDRYYKEDSIKGGFGIGLNIVKNICTKNSIDIICNSKEQEGTTFTYTFLNT